VEVVKYIFAEDGITTSIATSVEFGHFVTGLTNRPEADTIHYWISFPDRTVTSELALYLSVMESGKPEVAFIGSPLTLVLVKMLMGYTHRGNFTHDVYSEHPLINGWVTFRSMHACRAEWILPIDQGGVPTCSTIFNLEHQDFCDLVLPLLREESHQQSEIPLESVA